MGKSNIQVANLVFNNFSNDSRVLKESISLLKQGYEVEVIAHLDKDLKQEEVKEGFAIRRFSYLDRKVTKSKLGKFKAYYRYVRESVHYCKGFDVLHCNDLNTLPIAYCIKKFYNKQIKIVYDAHEYETETNTLKGLQKKLVAFLEARLIPYVDKILTVSDSIAEAYVKLYGIEKPTLVLNTPKYQQVIKKNLFRERFDISEDSTIFLYQGALTYGRGVETLLETFSNLEEQKSVIIFMGYGPLENQVIKASKEFTNIFFHQAVEPSVILDYSASADFGLSLIEDSCLSYRYCLPNKLFEYMMADIPVVVSNLPEMRQLVEKYQVGVVVEDESYLAIEDALEKAKELDPAKLLDNIQKVKGLYNWEEQEKKLLAVYNELTSLKSDRNS